jgi:hypothetical protein
LSVHPEEWRKQWFSMIPAGRLCDPYELKGVRTTVLSMVAEANSDRHMYSWRVMRRHT